MKTIREMIEEFISTTGEAHLENRADGEWVVFHDEGESIPLSDLAYNATLGFFQVSLFPNEPRECKPDPVKWSTAVFSTFDGKEEYQMWSIIPDDETNGFIIGEWHEVEALHQALARLIETGQADEEVDELDERLGHQWLSVSEASNQFGVPVDTVRYAARNSHIPMAQKQGRDWRFPQHKFLWWLNEVYQPRSEAS